jgi:hypothetical protein
MERRRPPLRPATLSWDGRDRRPADRQHAAVRPELYLADVTDTCMGGRSSAAARTLLAGSRRYTVTMTASFFAVPEPAT